MLSPQLFTTGLNSELRRRQSTDFIAQGERGKLHHTNSSHGGVSRDGLGIMGRRRRGDSTGAGMTLSRFQRVSFESTYYFLLCQTNRRYLYPGRHRGPRMREVSCHQAYRHRVHASGMGPLVEVSTVFSMVVIILGIREGAEESLDIHSLDD